MSKNADSKNAAYLREKDARLVKGIFKNFETPGGSLRFVFRKHKGEDFKKYTFVDGQIYTIPLSVAKHLNTNCHYAIHKYTTDDSGIPTMRIGQRVHRFGFQSLEFMDIEDLNPNPQSVIVTAEPLAPNAL
jgi:hypothetical protein